MVLGGAMKLTDVLVGKRKDNFAHDDTKTSKRTYMRFDEATTNAINEKVANLTGVDKFNFAKHLQAVPEVSGPDNKFFVIALEGMPKILVSMENGNVTVEWAIENDEIGSWADSFKNTGKGPTDYEPPDDYFEKLRRWKEWQNPENLREPAWQD